MTLEEFQNYQFSKNTKVRVDGGPTEVWLDIQSVDFQTLEIETGLGVHGLDKVLEIKEAIDNRADDAIQVFKDLLDHTKFLGEITIKNGRKITALGYAFTGILWLILSLQWEDMYYPLHIIFGIAGNGYLLFSCWYMYKKCR